MKLFIGHLCIRNEDRLSTISQTLSARQLKEELSNDQISRKFDAAYERLNHRLGYLEDRFGHGIDKLQVSSHLYNIAVNCIFFLSLRPPPTTSGVQNFNCNLHLGSSD